MSDLDYDPELQTIAARAAELELHKAPFAHGVITEYVSRAAFDVAAAVIEAVLPRIQPPGQLADRLHAMIRDLDGHIQRHGEEVAGPIVAAAEQDARQQVAEARAETQLKEDVLEEVRRRMAYLERYYQESRDCRGILSRALGHEEPAGMTLTGLVGEAVTRLDRAETEPEEESRV